MTYERTKQVRKKVNKTTSNVSVRLHQTADENRCREPQINIRENAEKNLFSIKKGI